MATRVVLEAGKADREYFKDLWRYRELFYVLAWRDVAVRYKQSVVGVAWAVMRPALSTVVLTVVFGVLGKFPSEGTPYPVLVLAGMLPWQLFSAGMSESANSLVRNSSLISKVYFPRLIIPLSSMLTSLIDFAISASMLVVVMLVYGVVPGWQMALLPAFVLLAVLSAAGIGIWTSALSVKYRDFSFVIPFVVQLGLYISPVGFSTSVVPERWRTLYALNPMVGVIDGFRWCIVGGASPIMHSSFLISVAIVVVSVVGGFAYFRRTERGFADVI